MKYISYNYKKITTFTIVIYQQGQWKKCCLCDGYFDDDGFGDILFVQQEPNNQKNVACNLCGKDKDIVQMKGTGQFLCEAACDEDDDED